MTTPHKHAVLIKQWADGAAIQRFADSYDVGVVDGWVDVPNPGWSTHCEYRVKPVPHKWQKEMDAYASGKTVQYRNGDATTQWMDVNPPAKLNWFTFDRHAYRIKPDRVELFTKAWIQPDNRNGYIDHPNIHHASTDNLKLTFEDGVLVGATILKG